MLKIAGILAFISFAVLMADAQKQMGLQDHLFHVRSPLVSDTIPFRSKPLFLLPLSFGINHHYQPDLFHGIPAVNEPFSIVTLTKDIDLASPWKQELAEQNEFRTLGLILGSIEAGGVAYIAYRHIRKYGF